jgi:hypothetical protein
MTSNPVENEVFDIAYAWDVFRMNLAEVIKELNDKDISCACSIEYQKRGMPLAHILITLDKSMNKMNLAEVIKELNDKDISCASSIEY